MASVPGPTRRADFVCDPAPNSAGIGRFQVRVRVTCENSGTQICDPPRRSLLGDHPIEIVRIRILDRHLHDIARLHPRRHVAQEHLPAAVLMDIVETRLLHHAHDPERVVVPADGRAQW